MESLRQQHKEAEKSHHEEMKRTKDDLTHRLEEKWKERLKYVIDIICSEVFLTKYKSMERKNEVYHYHSLNFIQAREWFTEARVVTATQP